MKHKNRCIRITQIKYSTPFCLADDNVKKHFSHCVGRKGKIVGGTDDWVNIEFLDTGGKFHFHPDEIELFPCEECEKRFKCWTT